jgi:uncharacterized membrane protein
VNKGKILHDLFRVSIAIKGIDGILEFISGISLMFIKSDFLSNIVQLLFQHELVQDPTDLVANLLIKSTQHLSTGTISFAAFYLIIHGLIKIGIVTSLLFRKLWAYPLGGVVLFIFVVYQVLRVLKTHSLILIFLTAIDILIIALLRSEYKRLLRRESG